MKDKIFKNLIYLFTILSISMLLVLVLFLFNESKQFLFKENIFNFIFGSKWSAIEGFEIFGIFNILLASILISILACIISFPLAFGISIFISFYAKKSKIFIKWLVGILAGIPSIIYGFFGLFFIVKFLENNFKLSSGESVLAGAILLSIMIFPYFVSSLVETMDILIERYKKDSDSLGISTEFFIRKIVISSAKLSMFLSFVLAFSRAIGETMAVMMVIGNTPIFPRLFSKAQTIPSLIALEVGMSEVGSVHYSALFASGLVLLILVFIINIILFTLNIKREKNE